MGTRVKVWSAYAAVAILFLSVINFLLFFVSGSSPVSLYISVPLGGLAVGYLVYAFLVPAILGEPDSKQLTLAGSAIATGLCGGKIGDVSIFGPFIGVTVYSNGLTLRPFKLGEYTIHRRDISSITDGGGFWLRRVVIEHTAPGKASPVVLTSRSARLRTAIMRIARDRAKAQAKPPVSDTSEGEVPRDLVWNLVSLMYLAGLVTFLVMVGFSVFDLVRAPSGNVAAVVFICLGLPGTYVFTRALSRNERRG